MNNIKHSLLRIAGVCSILAPLLLLVADIMQIVGGPGFEGTVVMWVSFVLFVPAIFGLSYLAIAEGSRLAFAGGASAYFGAMAGASMQVMFRVRAVLVEAGSTQAVELMRGSRKLFVTTQMIGIFFPLGLLILAFSLYRSGVVSPLIALSLAAGAILFPMGRIAGLLIGLIGGDLMLIIAFGVIGSRLLAAGSDELKRADVVQAQTG